MKNKLRGLTSLTLLLALLSSVAVAQQSASRATPSVEQLQKHVGYLASPHLEGRRTGSAGANDAAHYIAGEFSQIGLRTAFQTIRQPRNRAEARANYRQKFPYVAGVKLGSGNELSFDAAGSVTSFKVSDEWMPIAFSPNSRIDKLAAAFVGYGITAPDLKYDDYAGSNVSGKIAVAFSGTPDDESPHDQFARYKDERWKAITARNAGATALILIVRAQTFREAHLSQLRYDNAGDSGIPVLAISRAAGAKLLGMEGPDVLTKAQQAMKSWVQGGGPAANCKEPCGLRRNFNLPITSSITLVTDLVRQEVAAFNVIGILDGSDPTLKNEAIIIGAHYDHLGLGGEGSLAQKPGEVHHGADDNASGVAGMLELARVFSMNRPKPKRTIIFIAFSGEEEGLLGSNYYVNHPVVPLANTVAMINLDMIGRLKNKSLVIGGVGTAQEWSGMIERANMIQGYEVNVGGATAHAGAAPLKQVPLVVGSNGEAVVVADTSSKQFLLTLNQDGFGPSDHASFYAKQIPVLFFWTGTHSDYHKPSDTADKINYQDEARIITLVARLVSGISTNEKRPTYTLAKNESAGRSTGFRVYLGTIPNYAEANDGLLLDGVREDSPAAKAGLMAGDKIVKLAGRDVRNVYDYTHALSEMKAGEEYEVEILRGSERLKIKLTPAARK